MPIHRTTRNGKPAMQYGTRGAKYIYTAGNKASREEAKKKCVKQALAIQRRPCGPVKGESRGQKKDNEQTGPDADWAGRPAADHRADAEQRHDAIW